MTTKTQKSKTKKSESMQKEVQEDIVEEEPDESEDSEDDEAEDDEGIPLSDIDLDVDDEDGDIVPYIKLHKDNHAALTQALSTFALPIPSLPFQTHQSVTAAETVSIDINDNLQRELAFYKQAVDAAVEARANLLSEGVPFSRPSDYFAEMVKDDEHMEKVSLRESVNSRFAIRL